MNYNKIILVGRVTKQPEIKALPNGTKIVSFGLATNHIYFKGENKEKVETVQFHNIKGFGRTADTIGQYVKKGQEILVEGRVEYRSWDKKDGGKGYITEIMVESFQFGQKAGDAKGHMPYRNGQAPAAKAEQVPVIDLDEPVDGGQDNNGEEDLPF